MPPLHQDISRNLLRAAPLLLFFGAIFALIPLILAGASDHALTVAGIFASYALYRTALYDPPTLLTRRPVQRDGSPFPPEFIGRFLVIGIAHTVLAVVFSLAAIYLAPPGAEEAVFLVFIPNWLFLCAFGTLYPAAADGQSFAPAKALATARRTWPKVALQLALLPGLYGLVFIFAEQIARNALLPDAPVKPVLFAWESVATALGHVTQLLTAVILTRAYREAWPKDATT